MEHHQVGGWKAAERAQEEVGGAHTSGENRLGLRDACFLRPAASEGTSQLSPHPSRWLASNTALKRGLVKSSRNFAF